MKPKAWLVAAALAFCAPAANAATLVYASSDVPKIISTDSTPSSITIFSNLVVPDAFTIESLTVRLTVQHTWTNDIDLYLIGPTGLGVELSTDNGGSGDNYADTTFDDAALTSVVSGTAPFSGSYRPEGSLASFAGTSGLGLWRLQVSDDTIGFGGILHQWSLTFETAVVPEPETYALLLGSLSLLGFLRRATRPSRPSPVIGSA